MSSVQPKTTDELVRMRTSCRIVAEIVDQLIPLVHEGITTKELDTVAERLMQEKGVKSAFKGYQGFPAVLCTSVNDEIVHVIPGKRVLKTGDILSIDAGVVHEGMYSDMAVTIPVGTISPEAQRLIDVTKESLTRGISQAGPGVRIGAISNAIETYVRSQGFDVVRELVGHGIGYALHEEPAVPNFGPVQSGITLREGMTIAIEPMVTVGKSDIVIDGWRIATKDGSLAAHFEHTVVISENGAEILTTTSK